MGETVHKKTSALYVPERCSTSQFCDCGEPKQVTEMKCSFCSDPLRALVCHPIKIFLIFAFAKHICTTTVLLL